MATNSSFSFKLSFPLSAPDRAYRKRFLFRYRRQDFGEALTDRAGQLPLQLVLVV
jgi:hypothetical protein